MNKKMKLTFADCLHVCLLPHVTKWFTTIVLHRMVTECEWFLPELQAGFRQGRSTIDMITIVTIWIEAAIAQGRELLLYFSDFRLEIQGEKLDNMTCVLGQRKISAEVESGHESEASGNLALRC